MFERREFLRTGLLGGASLGILGAAAGSASAQAIDQLQMFIPAAPGGGWDQTGRSLEQAMKAANLIKSAQLTNKGGAGGVVGLPEFLNQWRGRPNAIMVAGLVMVGSIITNKAPVTLLSAVATDQQHSIETRPAASARSFLTDFIDRNVVLGDEIARHYLS